MISAHWRKYTLKFRFEARTSRETMWEKDTYLITLSDNETSRTADGECALFRGLSADDLPGYESLLSYFCVHPDEALACPYSSIRMGFETAFHRLKTPDADSSTPWLRGLSGIPINGLIWMGDKGTMLRRIASKIDAGFHTLKLKIGGINFDDECEILASIRREFSDSELTLRLDANGSFNPEHALEKLKQLSLYNIHSIEQPIKAGLHDNMAELCRTSPVDIALDEDLIGCTSAAECHETLEKIHPQYIILKPSLCGGFSGADTWIDAARALGIGWWATSALESNIGLEAIARWLSHKPVVLPQGLGTGQLYENNIPSALELRGENLFFNPRWKAD